MSVHRRGSEFENDVTGVTEDSGKRHIMVELLCLRAVTCLRHPKVELRSECGPVSQKQQHHDQEDKAYLMDDVGNIELSYSPPVEKYQVGSAATLPQGEGCDPWGDELDDQAFLEALEDVERRSGDDDVPDELLRQTMTEFESLKDLCLSGH